MIINRWNDKGQTDRVVNAATLRFVDKDDYSVTFGATGLNEKGEVVVFHLIFSYNEINFLTKPRP